MILEKWWGLSSGKLALSVARGQHGGVSSPEACGAQQVAHLHDVPLGPDGLMSYDTPAFGRQDLCRSRPCRVFFFWGSRVNLTDFDAQLWLRCRF